MTTETTVGREPIQILELDQDFCNLTYGTLPCTAAVGATGPDRCFNTRRTCQDTANYDRGTKTLRFVRPQANAPKDFYLIPSLVSIQTSPTIINTAGGNQDQKALGVRSTMTAVLTDHPHTDRIVDQYVTQRSYDPLERGTFWGKWLARNPYHQNRVVRVKEGYIGQTIASMQTRTYFIDRITGPDSSGRVTITARDVLSLADNRKAQAPAASVGELIEAELAAETTLRVTGAAAAEYPAPGMVRINSELITYTGVSTISGTEINLTGCTRGTNGTVAADHAAEDRVQLCLEYSTQNAVDIASDLLTTYAGVDASFIPTSDWNSERDTWLSSFDVSAIISEPTGVTDLLAELSRDCLFNIWWDERDQEIKLRAVRPLTASETPTALTDDANIIADSVAIRREPKERISQAWLFWGQVDPTQSVEEENNYARVYIRADLDRETDDLYGEQVIRKVYSRWVTTDSQAIVATSRWLSKSRDNPKYMSLSVDAKDRSLWTGDIVDVTNRGIVDQFGQQATERYQIISAVESDSGHRVDFKLLQFVFSGNAGLITSNTQAVYTASTEDEQQAYMFISDNDGLMSDGTPGNTLG